MLSLHKHKRKRDDPSENEFDTNTTEHKQNSSESIVQARGSLDPVFPLAKRNHVGKALFRFHLLQRDCKHIKRKHKRNEKFWPLCLFLRQDRFHGEIKIIVFSGLCLCREWKLTNGSSYLF